MIDITANNKLTAVKRLNSISGLQIQFDKLKTNWIVEQRDSTSGPSGGTAGGLARIVLNPSIKMNIIGNRI